MNIFKPLTLAVLFMTIAVASAACTKQEQLVNIQDLDKSIVIDLKYATSDNFLKKPIYTNNVARLRPQVAEALVKVQNELKPYGVGVKIWDAYRPLAAQQAMWDIVPDVRYVSNPKQGGRHPRGTAVDLTLIDLTTGKELKMPTGFDDFSEKAHRNNHYSDPIIKANMQLLDKIMHNSGFTGFETEWWHYDYKGWQDFSVLIAVDS